MRLWHIRVSDDLDNALEEWRKQQPGKIIDRTAAVNLLLRRALGLEPVDD